MGLLDRLKRLVAKDQRSAIEVAEVRYEPASDEDSDSERGEEESRDDARAERYRLPGEDPQLDALDRQIYRHVAKHEYRCPCCTGASFTTVHDVGVPTVFGSGETRRNHLLLFAIICGDCGHVTFFSRQILQPIVAFSE
jgi:hypothetical protein